MSTAPEYRVELDVFHGPLDLLLYLLKRDELDIYDIPIARITDTYLEYVNMLRNFSREDGLDINVAGDFLVMAATLMEIKSAMLLPKTVVPTSDGAPTAAQELADPRLSSCSNCSSIGGSKTRRPISKRQASARGKISASAGSARSCRR